MTADELVRVDPAVAADAATASEVVMALASSPYGRTAYSQADLDDEWSDLDVPALDGYTGEAVPRDGSSVTF